MYAQPDSRIRPDNLGMVVLNGQRYVINLRPGVPFNACVEEFDGGLRCWASHRWLDNWAASLVEKYASQTEDKAFTWKDNVKRGPVVCVKGDHTLYRVILP